MIRLSKHQLFTLMFIFEIGSTTIFALGIEAKQDAWIVILIAMLIGLGFVWVYTELQNMFPDKNYPEIITSILGNVIGMPLAFLYTFHFLWTAARNLREFGELMIITILPETPLWIILLVFVLVSIYVLIKGMESLARTSEIILPVILFFMLGLFLLLSLSGDIDIKKLAPVLGGGITPVLKTVPSVAYFPFSELYVFLMYWCYVNEKEDIRRISIKVVILSGILLCFTLMLDITVLGSKYSSIAAIPLVEAIRLINVRDIITNLDIVGITIMFLGGFFKLTIHLYAIVLVLASIFKIKNIKVLIIIVGTFLFWFAIVFEPSFAYHKWMIPFDALNYGVIFADLFPALLLIIYWLKKERAKL